MWKYGRRLLSKDNFQKKYIILNDIKVLIYLLVMYLSTAKRRFWENVRFAKLWRKQLFMKKLHFYSWIANDIFDIVTEV